jgi:Domain of unknown function (DUF5069)
MNAPDLTKRPPRSVRVRLGGFVILARMLDKGRAEIAGVSGEYHYNCPLDKHFLDFAGIDPAALRIQLSEGRGDGEILGWISENAAHKRSDLEIEQWSSYHDRRGPSSVEQREWFQALHREIGMLREDIFTWADLLDLDDFCSFGGKA